MFKSLSIIIFLTIAFVGFSPEVSAQQQNTSETVAWKHETKTYFLEVTITLDDRKPQTFGINTYRIVRGGESANECDTLVKRGEDESVWTNKGRTTHITGKNDLGAPINITIEKRKNGFFIKSDLCENVGVPNVLLTKKGSSYRGRIVG